MNEWVTNSLGRLGLVDKENETAVAVFMLIGVAILCILGFLIVRKIVLAIAKRIIKRSKKRGFADIMLKHRALNRLCHLVPPIILSLCSSLFPSFSSWFYRFIGAYVVIVVMLIVDSLIDCVDDIYRSYEISKTRPIKSLLQVIKIVVYVIGGIILIASLVGQSPLVLLGGIGAMTAVLSLVFKDSILGFVAGIQLTSNDMVRIGDWIEMAKYSADGTVLEISLNTVKVENFDKTITTIPAYALVSDSFRNWRGMVASGGRRIKRSIYIDVGSITLCTDEMIERFKKIDYLKDYISQKQDELSNYNSTHSVDLSEPINGRRMTNIGTFRAYIQSLLDNHSGINKDMLKMVRQLQPVEQGLPLEIYAFTNSTQWEYYENVQSDIFDHLLAIAPRFGLRVYQAPSGWDFRQG
ncbi:MAG TPA: mechanosensitive ion channel domain-containing protein [Oscillospiraceae bacterium]|nr:mechanosensitive ion channel domain-containing protein [Oscillospiraceae bacterium]